MLEPHRGDCDGNHFQDQNGWTVEAVRLKTNETSTYTTKTLNDKGGGCGMHGGGGNDCDDYEQVNLPVVELPLRTLPRLLARANIDLKWQSEVRHDECNQKVELLSNGDVRLEYS